MIHIWFYLSTIFSFMPLILQEWRLLLYFQQEEYSFARFLKWVLNNLASLNLLAVSVFGISYLLSRSPSLSQETWLIVLRIIANVILAAPIYISIAKPKKIKLAYTSRLQRLIIVLILVTGCVKMLFEFLVIGPLNQIYFAIVVFDLVFFFFSPIFIGLANLLVSPIERSINNYYLKEAQKKIEKIAPYVIGITGSYGKTSTKEILAHILEGSKSTLATPKSYNTLLGVTKVINTSLRTGHEVFIVEMGAYRPGEIADISRLVGPSVGIITAIGPQHLERFRTIENVAKAKFELIKALPESGLAVFNADDSYTNIFLGKMTHQTCVLIGTSSGTTAQLIASNVNSDQAGLEFWVENKKTGEKALFQTGLLGNHNVVNILLASAVALHLGLGLRKISERIKSLKPVTHRLQLIKLPSGVKIIDDAYNSNPVGARNALDALSLFSGRKILITPGLVELAEIQKTENFKLGQYASKICDLVVLIGEKQTLPIFDGLIAEQYERSKIKVLNSTKEGTEYVNSIVKSGDTVLYLNDLPDLYS